jgi:hypothetical protein
MNDPTSSYAAVGIALKVSGALKAHRHDKVETPSVGYRGIDNYKKNPLKREMNSTYK